MREISRNREARRLRQVAAEYRRKGYRVKVQPASAELPAELKNVRPDLIATRGKERVIVEVKTRKTLARSRQLSALAEAAERLGWRFELVLTNPEPGGPVGSLG